MPETAQAEQTELAVLDLVSAGHTNAQIGRQLELPVDSVKAAKQTIVEQLGAKSIAGAVHTAIEAGLLPIEADTNNPASELTASDRTILGVIAKGGTTWQIAKAMGVDGSRAKRYNNQLLRKVGAWSTAHAIRRAHELGVLTAGINQS